MQQTGYIDVVLVKVKNKKNILKSAFLKWHILGHWVASKVVLG